NFFAESGGAYVTPPPGAARLRGRRHPPRARSARGGGMEQAASQAPDKLLRGGCYPSADLAAHAGTAEPAVAKRVLRQILLVIILGVVERRRVEDFRGDRTVAALVERRLESRLRRFGGRALRRARHVDAGAILRADVVALAHA